MELSDLLDRENAHVREKEAEALAILKSYGGSAIQQYENAKRQVGHILPHSELGTFVSLEATEMFKRGRKEATILLFDAYAETAFRFVGDAEAFIALLGQPICKRVRATLDVLDDHEAELRKLEWTRRAWKRKKPTLLGRVWDRFRPRVRHSVERPSLAQGPASDSPDSQPPDTNVKMSVPLSVTGEIPAATGGDAVMPEPEFPTRALWLADRLRERSWNKNDVASHNGPDRKTVQKILDGYAVREDVLEKLANALSQKRSTVEVLDIPQN
jgi:hypothetical protein